MKIFRTCTWALGLLLLWSAALAEDSFKRTIPKPMPHHPGFIFQPDEEVEVYLRGSPAVAGWVCLDYDQKEEASGKASSLHRPILTIRPGKLPVGYHEIWALNTVDERLHKVSFAVVEPLKAPIPLDSPLCVDLAASWFFSGRNGDPARVAEAASLASLAGMNRVRDRLVWKETEPERGKFAEETIYDDAARIQAEYGLQVLTVFHDSPAWANPNVMRFPTDLRDAYNYVKTMSARWKGQVFAWEPWNEGDISGFGGQPGSEMATYQKAAYWGLRAGNTNAVVCQNVFAYAGKCPALENCAENDFSPYCDTHNFHHYHHPEAYSVLYAAEREAAGGRPLWVTESGIHVKWDPENKDQDPVWEEMQRQARFIPQNFATSLYEGSQATFYFMLGNYIENDLQYGLLRKNLTPRPGYSALAAAGRLMAGAKPLGVLRGDPKSPLHVYAFQAQPDGEAKMVLVAWSDSKTATVPLPAALKPTAAFDFLGRTLSTETNKFEVSAESVYLMFPPGSEKQLALTPPPVATPQKSAKPCPAVLQILLPHERVVLKASGYRIGPKEKLDVPVYAYNFGDKPISTVVKVTAKGVTIKPTELPVEIKPMDRVELHFQLASTKEISMENPVRVKFSADCGEQGGAVTVARFVTPLADLTPAKSKPIPAAAQAANWQKNASGEMTIEQTPEGVLFDGTLAPTIRWIYPTLTLPADQQPKGDWDGISFTFVPLASQADYKALFDKANGACYVGGTNIDTLLEMGKPYHVVALFRDSFWGPFSKPDKEKSIHPGQICSLKLGCNSVDPHVRFVIRDVSWVKFAK